MIQSTEQEAQTPALDRQQVTVGVHLDPEPWRWAPELWPASPDHLIACVEIIGGLRVQTSDPRTFRDLAALFTAGADGLDAALVGVLA